VLSRLFPKTGLNEYKGYVVAKWMFVAMTVLTMGRSLAHILLPDGGAQSIATIPLGAFSSNAAAVVVGMFAQWGLTQLLFSFVYVFVLLRYQALIPSMWLFILIEYGGRQFLGFYKPFETVGQAPGGIGNMIFPVLAIVMLVLSLMSRKAAESE
jgi:hypothetical protein